MANGNSQVSGDQESLTSENDIEQTAGTAENSGASSSVKPNFLPMSNAQVQSLVQETIDKTTASFLKSIKEKFVPLKSRPRAREDYNQASTSSGKRHHINREEFLRAQRSNKRETDLLPPIAIISKRATRQRTIQKNLTMTQKTTTQKR